MKLGRNLAASDPRTTPFQWSVARELAELAFPFAFILFGGIAVAAAPDTWAESVAVQLMILSGVLWCIWRVRQGWDHASFWLSSCCAVTGFAFIWFRRLDPTPFMHEYMSGASVGFFVFAALGVVRGVARSQTSEPDATALSGQHLQSVARELAFPFAFILFGGIAVAFAPVQVGVSSFAVHLMVLSGVLWCIWRVRQGRGHGLVWLSSCCAVPGFVLIGFRRLDRTPDMHEYLFKSSVGFFVFAALVGVVIAFIGALDVDDLSGRPPQRVAARQHVLSDFRTGDVIWADVSWTNSDGSTESKRRPLIVADIDRGNSVLVCIYCTSQRKVLERSSATIQIGRGRWDNFKKDTFADTSKVYSVPPGRVDGGRWPLDEDIRDAVMSLYHEVGPGRTTAN